MTTETVSTSELQTSDTDNASSPSPLPNGPASLESSSKAGLWSTKGRIGRVRYFNRVTLPSLIVNAISAVLFYYSLTAAPAAAETAATTLTISQLILAIPLTIFALIQGKRRLNDQNRSGWLQLLFLIPLAGLVPVIMMTFIRGTEGDNRFGAQPAPPTSNDMTLFWTLIGLVVAACVALVALTP